MIETPILDVLRSLQVHGETHIIGGYLRDKLAGVKPKDVDMVTRIPFATLKELIPNLHTTEQGEKLGVGRFQRHSYTFEITSISHDIKSELSTKDFVLNTLAHDGENLIDFFGAQEQIEKRVISPQDIFLQHTEHHPQAYLRAIRIASKINATLDPELLQVMKQQKNIFFSNHENRIRQEGYEILHSAYPQVGVHILYELGLLYHAHPLERTPLSFDPQDVPYILAFLSLTSNRALAKNYVRLFKLKPALADDALAIMKLDKVKKDTLPQREFNKYIKWMRYRLQLEPEKLQAFFAELKERFSK